MTNPGVPPTGVGPAGTPVPPEAPAGASNPFGARLKGAIRAGGTSVGAIAVALLVGAIVILITGGDPILTYRALLSGAFGSQRGIAETLVAATPLALGGMAFAMAARAGLFNIGIEGQLFLGSLATALVAATDFGLPTIIHLPFAIIVGMLVGGLWAGLAGGLRARTGASEVITTIMLNYIAYRISSWAVRQRWLPVDPERDGSERALDTARFERILDGTRLHAGVMLVPVVAIIIWFLLFRTTFGYRIRAVGLSRGAAAYAGIPWGLTITLAMVVSGALAGLGGALEITGVSGRHTNPNPGYGFTAIAVGLAGRNHPIGVVFAGILFGAMNAGSTRMQSVAGTSAQLVQMLQALVILAIAASAAMERFRLWSRVTARFGPRGGQVGPVGTVGR